MSTTTTWQEALDTLRELQELASDLRERVERLEENERLGTEELDRLDAEREEGAPS